MTYERYGEKKHQINFCPNGGKESIVEQDLRPCSGNMYIYWLGLLVGLA